MCTPTGSGLAKLIVAARTDPGSLAPEKLMQLQAYVGYTVLTWQTMFLQFELGNLSASDWEATKLMIKAFTSYQLFRVWALELASYYNPRFHEELNNILAEH